MTVLSVHEQAIAYLANDPEVASYFLLLQCRECKVIKSTLQVPLLIWKQLSTNMTTQFRYFLVIFKYRSGSQWRTKEIDGRTTTAIWRQFWDSWLLHQSCCSKGWLISVQSWTVRWYRKKFSETTHENLAS